MSSTTDKAVLDFVKGINQLCKDTGLEIKSFDWSEAMIETDKGRIYFLCKDSDSEEYYAELGASQPEQVFESQAELESQENEARKLAEGYSVNQLTPQSEED